MALFSNVELLLQALRRGNRRYLTHGTLNLLIFLLFLLLVLSSCQQKLNYARLSGFSMGTSYQVVLQIDEKKSLAINQQIRLSLEKITQLMSTYIDYSEISKFNRSSSLDCQKLSDETYFVIKNALTVSRLTQGKFDITIAPLVLEWGFDSKLTFDEIPSNDKIKQLLLPVGYKKLRLGKQCVAKSHADLSINLSAIAKGYAVDQIAELLTSNGIKNYLVEFGGETQSKGRNPQSKPWRLAIQSPDQAAGTVQQIFYPFGLGVATSGNYRNYFENKGVRYSHSIDPQSGKPVNHSLLSVTVLHPQTMLADAYATAFMVMGEEKALEFAQQHQLPVYLVIKTDQGLKTVLNSLFEKHL